MCGNWKRVSFVFVLVVLLGMTGPVLASSLDGSAIAKSQLFNDWVKRYEDAGGDSNVVVSLSSSRRGLSTERVAATGSVTLNLLDGGVKVELQDLDRTVEVWVLDNKPGPNRNLLPQAGDTLLRIATVKPGQGVVENEFGSEFFRGVEVNWVLVSQQGESPAVNRLLYGTRSYFEILYTRQRLAEEGFSEERPALQSLGGKATEEFPILEPEPTCCESGGGDPIAARPHISLVTKGLVPQDVFDGGEVFFRETFEGNGRSCGTCHPAENNQTVEPAFIATLPNSDPLFVAEQRAPSDPISNLERPPLMRNFGLILENVDGLEDPNNKFLMRSVPHSLSLFTSLLAQQPNETPFEDRTGWSGDGAPPPGRLIEFLLGAIIQHYPNNSLDRVFKENVGPGEPFDFRMPTDDELHDTNEYMLAVGRTNQLVIANISLTNSRAENGRNRFINSACNGCHSNLSSNIATGVNRSFVTNVELLDNPALGFEGIRFPHDGGFLGQGLALPNRDCDNDGILDCFGDGSFNTPPLVEAADTAPFFHNNAITTVEGAVNFYNGPPFQVVNFTADEVDDVGALLRVVNAAFNLAIAIQRNQAVLVIDPAVANSLETTLSTESSEGNGNGVRPTANKLLLLSNDEIIDALQVLTEGPLGNLDSNATSLATQARDLNSLAIGTSSGKTRGKLIQDAIAKLQAAKASLGTGMDFVLGSGNLLF